MKKAVRKNNNKPRAIILVYVLKMFLFGFCLVSLYGD